MKARLRSRFAAEPHPDSHRGSSSFSPRGERGGKAARDQRAGGVWRGRSTGGGMLARLVSAYWPTSDAPRPRSPPLLPVRIKPLARLPAELAGRDHIFKSGQGRYLGSPRPSCSTSMIARQMSRPIRSASASGPIGWFMPSFITVSIASLVGHAFHEREDRLVDHRHEDAVGDEARVVVRPRPASCPSALGQVLGQRVRRVAGREAADDLDQLHDRHRVHEVHADHAVGALRHGGDLGDRDARGVGGEDRVGAAATASSASKICRLSAKSSLTASTASWQRRAPRPSRSAAVDARERARPAPRPSAPASSRRGRGSCRSSPSARSTNSALRRRPASTSKPSVANTCAMPLPIVPPPTTAARRSNSPRSLAPRSHALHRERHRVAAAQAQRREAGLRAAVLRARGAASPARARPRRRSGGRARPRRR